MSKVGGALPSWYWPAGIPRRVPVAQQPLGRLLRQRFTSAKDRLAIARDDLEITYAQLLEKCLALAGGLQNAKLTGTIAVAEPDPVEALSLVLGGWFAGRCVFIADPAAAKPDLDAQLAQAKATALIAHEPAASLQTIAPGDLSGTFNQTGGARRATEPAAMIMGARGLVVHSNFSLAAMAISMASFIPNLREMPFVCHKPHLGSWEMLTGILLSLLHGAPIRFDHSIDGNGGTAGAGGGYIIISRNRADRMTVDRRVPAVVRDANYVFVSTGYFGSRWRQRVEHTCRRPVFPVWGLPEMGPLVAAHPTWLPPHGHGFPLVNVSLIPIDPGNGKVSIVPWEMLEQAEVGVESLAAMVGYADPAQNLGVKSGTAVRTRQVASMDHVGVVVLQDASSPAQEAPSAH